MDWDKAIERYELPLLRIVGALIALLVSARLDGAGLMVPRRVWRAVLFVLRPAEAAVRRLIIIAARALTSVAPVLRERRANAVRMPVERPSSAVVMAPAFQLFDPLKHFDFEPNDGGCGFDGAAAFGADDLDDTPINAIALHNRLRALRHALADLSRQATRLARFNARRDALLKALRPVRLSPMRPGLPPGWRQRPRHEVDTVLRDCHQLAHHLEDTRYLTNRLDTS